MNKTQIVVVEDDRSLLDIASYHLELANYKVHLFNSAEDAWLHIQKELPDIVVTDLVLEGAWSGQDLLRHCQSIDKDLPIILMTANGSIDNAVACLHEGAWTYFEKPFRWEDMLAQLAKAVHFRSLHCENKQLRSLLQNYEKYNLLIGRSKGMIRLKEQMHRVSMADAPVLVLGESGTGKELVARSIHLNSLVREGPFVAVNCGAIVSSLAESELFGHCKGAFSGAFQDKEGLFLKASGGTLFLDEVGELSLELQVKLLRVIQEAEVMPVGATKPLPVKFRLICATNVDLHKATLDGTFREDLFYRISVLPLLIPALRDRREDIAELALHFFKQQGIERPSLSDALMVKLERHAWRGNIRELQNIILRMVIFNAGTTDFDVKHWLEDNKPIKSVDSPHKKDMDFLLKEDFVLEKHIESLIESALKKYDGNQSKAAKCLGITRSALIYKMQKLNLG